VGGGADTSTLGSEHVHACLSVSPSLSLLLPLSLSLSLCTYGRVRVGAETLGRAPRQYARYDRDKSEIARQVRADLWDVYRVLIFSARERASAGLRRGLSRNATKFINPGRRVRKSPDGSPNHGPIATTIRQDPSSAFGSIGFSDRVHSTL